jgi:hypothetical protein
MSSPLFPAGRKSLTRLFLLLGLLCSLALAQQDDGPAFRTSYDVIVVGSEPEGVSAAVAAAQEGASVLLVTTDARIGGLFVTGEMNSLDLRLTPVNYQRGLFVDWWERVGRGHSFDVRLAERAFNDMLQEAGVQVAAGVPAPLPLFALSAAGEPLLEAPVGIQVAGTNIFSQQIIDATSEAGFAAGAGAVFTLGFSSLGLEARMADTLVFRITGVDWIRLQAGIRARGKGYATVDDHVAWGHFGGYPARFKALEEGIRLRGLNMGRQQDGSLLVNALLIHGIDPFDPDSVAQGRARAEREAPRIIEYLKAELPGFENARYGGAAETLYIRETRHLEAQCLLTADQVLDNEVTEHAIAVGGYPLDVQTLTPADNGYVYGTPVIYGVELCMTVPDRLQNVWVAGKAAGFDPIAASSARVVPFGMVIAEAVGVAAARSSGLGVTPAEFAADPAQIGWLRERLTQRGAYLPPVQHRDPVGPFTDPHHAAYRLLLGRGLALGGYDNEPQLHDEVLAISYVYMLSNVGRRFLGNTELGPDLVANFQYSGEALTWELAARITAFAACRLERCVDPHWPALQAAGFAPAGTGSGSGVVLTRGEMYALAASFASLAAD